MDKYGSVYEGVKCSNLYSRYYNVILMTKKLLFMTCLICCYEYPLFQVINLTLLSGFLSVILIVFKPLENQNEFTK